MNIGDMEDSNFDFYVPLKGHFEVDQEGVYGKAASHPDMELWAEKIKGL